MTNSLAQGTEAELEAIVASLQQSDRPLTPFHWEIEFPEVFDRKNPGFDAIVGNPPFLGGTMISGAYSKEYLEWITSQFPETGNRTDFVAYFFRRAFNLTRDSGSCGLIATNTIAQGDTRKSGLRWICAHGGTIYEAYKRLKWPGLAAVAVSVIHVYKGKIDSPYRLDGKNVQKITAFLFHAGGNEDPKKLSFHSGRAFSGVKHYGDGFLFEDGKEKSTSIEIMQALIDKDPKNKERIFPFIGGEEVNASPTQSHHRFIINFGEMSEDEAWNWPDLMHIIEAKVKPERLSKSADIANWPWWRFWRVRRELYDSIKDMDRVLVNSIVSAQFCFAFLPSDWVYSHALNVITFSQSSVFSIFQSQVHEVWARFFSSSLEDRLRYTPSDCLETFPFPENWETDSALEEIGKAYYEYRADLMVRKNEGLTATYNRFHDPHEDDPDILKLRELHDQMDRAVLDAYGWTDILGSERSRTPCGFALDYLDAEPEDLPTQAQERVESGDLFFPTAEEAAAFDVLVRSNQAKRGKLPWRYKWPEAIHDDVLARLLDLNQKRYDEEVRLGLHGNAKAIGKGTTKQKGTAKKKGEIIKEDQQGELLFSG
ncbi:type IIL restriction-modification enzyme MmeI [Phormidium sp. FACHB-1136]|uniref:Eco57I restriction-modification methylase domain-containing protein n=1 Tax=Phormidium sp. FACHB-1136 TaxID=2692848 RepID=UPI0018EFFB69|nr:type IIL restriction-modification enzyme MmeI [Phormidium sp. FACHB-1136]